MATKDGTSGSTGGAPFEPILATRKPEAIAADLTARLEEARRAKLNLDRKSLAVDRDILVRAVKDISPRARPGQVRKLVGLIGLLDEQLAQIEDARKAIKEPPAIPANGWLLLGRVREADGSPPKDAMVTFEGGGDAARKLLQPVKLDAQGEARLALAAKDLAELNRQGVAVVKVTVVAGDQRQVADVVPARIVPGGLHQFDLTLPGASTGRTKKRGRAK